MELMAVIVILGISFAALAPRFRQAVTLGELDQTVRAVIARVHAKRQAAIQNQEAQPFYIDLENRTIGGTPEAGPEDWEAVEIKGGFPVPRGVEITDVQWPDGATETGGVVKVRITPEGYIQQAAIHLADDDRQVTLFLEPFLGRVRVQEDYAPLEPSS